MLDAGVQHRLRRPIDEVVGVLHAHDLGAVQRDSQMFGHDTAQPDAADQPFVAGLDHRGELSVEQFSVDLRRGVGVGGLVVDAEVDRGETVGPQRLQILLDGGTQLVGLLRGQPRSSVVALGADLAHQRQISGVGVQRFADQLIGHIRSVELRRVDVVDAQLDCAPQYGERLVVVARRAEDTRPG